MIRIKNIKSHPLYFFFKKSWVASNSIFYFLFLELIFQLLTHSPSILTKPPRKRGNARCYLENLSLTHETIEEINSLRGVASSTEVWFDSSFDELSVGWRNADFNNVSMSVKPTPKMNATSIIKELAESQSALRLATASVIALGGPGKHFTGMTQCDTSALVSAVTIDCLAPSNPSPTLNAKYSPKPKKVIAKNIITLNKV